MRLLVPRTALRMRAAMMPSCPVLSMTPPNIMAVMINQSVGSMLAIPPRLRSSSSAAFPDCSTNPLNKAVQQPFTSATGSESDGSST